MVKPVCKALVNLILSSALLLIFLLDAGPMAAQSGAPSGYASVRGTVADSVRSGPLIGAYVELQPGVRQTLTNDRGEFRFDSLPTGISYSIRVIHPMLDTVGVALVTPEFLLQPGEAKQLNLAVPPPPRLVSMFCPPEQRARGPSALVGFVRDPDTGAPIDSATVSLVYDDGALGIKRPVNRIAKLDASGRYKICGLPTQMIGRVQLIRNGTQSADIPVSTDAQSPLALRSLGMSLSTRHIAAGKDSLGNTIRVLRGSARVTGRVITKSGVPVAGARVQMDETAAATITGADGRFALDSVPTGTQTLSVRKIGFAVTDKAVEVSLTEPATVSVVIENYIPTLDAVVTIGQRDIDKEKVGFTRRKRQGAGVYREGDAIPRNASSLGTALSTLPGIRVGNGPNGSMSITASGGPYSCVTFIVDGVVWREDSSNASLSDYVRPDELQALELYTASTVPSEFAVSAQSNCRVLVLWTTRKIRSGTGKVIKPFD